MVIGRGRCGLVHEGRHVSHVMRVPRMGEGRRRRKLKRDHEDRGPKSARKAQPEGHPVHFIIVLIVVTIIVSITILIVVLAERTEFWL